ncbi:MAG: enoyl-CoA hydratase/isomerase family protein [Pseudomonadota bacterium]
MTDKVLIRIDDDGNSTVMLNRPQVHNAFDPEMVEALTTAFESLGADPQVRAIVLVGAGDSFCAGADITHMKASAQFTRQQNHEAARTAARMFHTIYTCPKPTIAAVRGAVRGGGCGLVCACDIAVATRTATFRFTEVKLGIIPAIISPYVIAAIGSRMSHRYMLTGEEMSCAEAYRIGLVHEIAEEEHLSAAVGALLGHLYTGGPAAISAIKALIPMVAHASIDDALIDETSNRIAKIRTTPEAQEGLSAFIEKRKPAWFDAKLKRTPRTRKSSPRRTAR